MIVSRNSECSVACSQQVLFSHTATETSSVCRKRYLEDSGCHGSTLPVKTPPANEGNVHSESDNKWNQFREEFECQLDSSEREMHQVEFQKLHENLLVAAALGFKVGHDQEESKNTGEQWSSITGQYGQVAGSELLLNVRADFDSVPAVLCTSHTPSSPRPTPAQHHGILHSNKYERISEVELDLVLEAIEEESEYSREGSRSPSTITSTK